MSRARKKKRKRPHPLYTSDLWGVHTKLEGYVKGVGYWSAGDSRGLREGGGGGVCPARLFRSPTHPNRITTPPPDVSYDTHPIFTTPTLSLYPGYDLQNTRKSHYLPRRMVHPTPQICFLLTPHPTFIPPLPLAARQIPQCLSRHRAMKTSPSEWRRRRRRRKVTSRKRGAEGVADTRTRLKERAWCRGHLHAWSPRAGIHSKGREEEKPLMWQ
eukprot:745822-Hanusia_phi.AAC.4